MKDLEDAENLCITLNRQEVSKGRKIKVHLHPKICKIRESPINSQFSQMFNQNGYSFTDLINESNISMKKCISLMNLYPKKAKIKVKNIKKKQNVMNKAGYIENDNIDNEDDQKLNVDNQRVKNKTDNKINTISKSRTNSISQKSEYINESLLSLLLPKKEPINDNKQLTDKNTNETRNVVQSVTKNINIMHTMSHLLIKLKETPQNQPVVNQDDKKQLATPTESETPDINDCNKEDKSKEIKDENEELSIDYEPSVIKYYTYNMKNQEYYDNKIIEIQEAKKFKHSSNQFVEKLKIKKIEIENTLNKEKERNHYINVKSIPINEKYPKEREIISRDREYERSRNLNYDKREDIDYDRKKDRHYDRNRDSHYEKRRNEKYYKEDSIIDKHNYGSQERVYERDKYDRRRNRDKSNKEMDRRNDNNQVYHIKKYNLHSRSRSYSRDRSRSYRRYRSRSKSDSNKRNRKEENNKYQKDGTYKSYENPQSYKFAQRNLVHYRNKKYDNQYKDGHNHYHSHSLSKNK